ncbi:MAG TPA: phosphoribosyltransferase [Pseudonocardia sp.]|jgi:hypothetical protein|nr:phosphoribosyltransferase [Pseudonocardia sp.]
MIPDALAKQLRQVAYNRVGAFFSNTERGPGRCAVCTAPTLVELCSQCAAQRASYGTGLADLVVPLAYVRGWMSPRHQSEHHVWRYKHPVQPSPGCLDDLRLMMLAGTLLHGDCIARAVGLWWDVVTFVPSATRPGTGHPVVELARQVGGTSTRRILLDIGPGIHDEARGPRPDRFVVPPEYVPVIRGQHVLAVDDTWVSGGKAQSAALALKVAGAARVTIVCIGRWLSYRWDEHRALIESLTDPYDAMRCPVTGGACLR